MKKVISGVGLLLSGTIFFISANIIASLTIDSVTEWNDERDKFFRAMANAGFSSIFQIGTIAMVVGLLLIVWGLIVKDNRAK